MGTAGFFTRSELKKPSKTVRKSSGVSVGYLHSLGLSGLDGYNPRAHTPLMSPDGGEDAAVYVLGSHPLQPDDEEGYPFAGPSGRYLRRQLKASARYSYVVRTRPPAGKELAKYEIECSRPSLVQDIEATRPSVVLAVGKHAIKWCLPDLKASPALMNDRQFPVRIGDHVCWVVCCYEPDYIRAIEKKHRVGLSKVPGKEVKRHHYAP